MTELADFLCGETETYSKESLKVPDLNAEAMVMKKEVIEKMINTLASVKVEVGEAPKIIGVINLLSQELANGKEE